MLVPESVSVFAPIFRRPESSARATAKVRLPAEVSKPKKLPAGSVVAESAAGMSASANELPKASVAPTATVLRPASAKPGSEAAEPATSVPVESVRPPVKVLLPESVRVPVPILVSEPGPVREPAKEVERSVVPTVSAIAAGVAALFCRASEPEPVRPATVKALPVTEASNWTVAVGLSVAFWMANWLASRSVPAEAVAVPEKVLAPPRVWMPVPVVVTLPVPLIRPEKEPEPLLVPRVSVWAPRITVPVPVSDLRLPLLAAAPEGLRSSRSRPLALSVTSLLAKASEPPAPELLLIQTLPPLIVVAPEKA